MAEIKRPKRNTETVRQRSEKTDNDTAHPRRLRKTANSVARPIKAVHRVGRKEYLLPLPDNRVGRFLNRRQHLTPAYFRESWHELRQVIWPSRKETWKLTFAVFTFAIVFGLLIAITDFGLDKVFKRILT